LATVVTQTPRKSRAGDGQSAAEEVVGGEAARIELNKITTNDGDGTS
jgi:hypothetical protein